MRFNWQSEYLHEEPEFLPPSPDLEPVVEEAQEMIIYNLDRLRQAYEME